MFKAVINAAEKLRAHLLAKNHEDWGAFIEKFRSKGDRFL